MGPTCGSSRTWPRPRGHFTRFSGRHLDRVNNLRPELGHKPEAAPTSHGLNYSAGIIIIEEIQEASLAPPEWIWEPAYDAGGRMRGWPS